MKLKIQKKLLLIYMCENDLKILKTECPDIWKNLTKTLTYPYEHFKSLDDHKKTVDNLKKEDFFNHLKIDYRSDEEIERTKKLSKKLIIKMERN